MRERTRWLHRELYPSVDLLRPPGTGRRQYQRHRRVQCLSLLLGLHAKIPRYGERLEEVLACVPKRACRSLRKYLTGQPRRSHAPRSAPIASFGGFVRSLLEPTTAIARFSPRSVPAARKLLEANSTVSIIWRLRDVSMYRTFPLPVGGVECGTLVQVNDGADPRRYTT